VLEKTQQAADTTSAACEAGNFTILFAVDYKFKMVHTCNLQEQ
jgi:hypothetical protein